MNHHYFAHEDAFMLKPARHSRIREILDETGQVTVAQLNAWFLVSEATIRRDLDEMDRMGLLRRTHGGAVRTDDTEPPIILRQTEQATEKERIGQRAAQLVTDDQTVFLGSGTTVQAMLPHLMERRGLTVITNSLPIINAFVGRETELIVIGGYFRDSELSMVGHIAEEAINELRADLAFMGMRGIDPDRGFTSDYLPEALTDRAILRVASRRVVLADHSKFGRVGAVYLAPVTAAEVIITDDGLDPTLATTLQEKGIELILT